MVLSRSGPGVRGSRGRSLRRNTWGVSRLNRETMGAVQKLIRDPETEIRFLSVTERSETSRQ